MPTVINGTSTATGIHYKETTTTTVSDAVGVTYTAASLLDGVIVRNPGLVNKTDTLPSASSIVSGMQADNSAVVVGSSFTFLVHNNGGLATVTLQAGSGGTLTGTTLIPINQVALLTCVLTNVTPSLESANFYSVGK